MGRKKEKNWYFNEYSNKNCINVILMTLIVEIYHVLKPTERQTHILNNCCESKWKVYIKKENNGS